MPNSVNASPWSIARVRSNLPMSYVPPAQADAMLFLVEDLSDPDLPRGTVYWAGESGIMLVPPTEITMLQKWNGQIAVAGYIDRLHIRQLDGEQYLIAEIVGQALPIGYHILASRKDMRSGFLAIPRDRAMTAEEYVYPFLLDPEGSFAMLAQDALVSGLAVDVMGSLAPEGDPRYVECGLPLMPESLTVFSAG